MPCKQRSKVFSFFFLLTIQKTDQDFGPKNWYALRLESCYIDIFFRQLKKILDKGSDISPLGTTKSKDKQEVSCVYTSPFKRSDLFLPEGS